MWVRSLLVMAVVAAQQQDPIQDFCRRHQHQTCVIDNKLYIDGGKVYYGGSVENGSVAQQNTWLLWEDVLATDNETEFPTQYKDLRKDPDVPSVSGGVLWPDETNRLFYLYGGEYNEVADVQTFTRLWYFDVIYKSWNRTISSDTQASISWPAFGSGTISEAGVAYYYGGYLNNKTVPRWGSTVPWMLNSLVSYDMNKGTWSNRTYDTTPRAEGILQFIPASASGMLVYFGGLQTDSNGGVTYANMSEIQLFDINDSKWYKQAAMGEVPSPRRGACAGFIEADDRSSYNFYMWGGIGPDGQAFDEVWLLTLPSFQWALLWPNTIAEVPNYSDGRGWPTCNVVRRSQMIAMGGSVPASSPKCDVADLGGQHGMLLGQESMEVNPPETQWWWRLWRDYNGYRVPDKLVSLIGGNTSGHATRTVPLQGWATPSNAGYFKDIMYMPARTATRSIPTTPTASPTSEQAKTKGPNVGAIAGGIVGGLVGLAGLIALVYLCLRHKGRQRIAHNPPELDDSQRPELEVPTMTQKPSANYAMADGGGLSSSATPTPAYSPQASPPLPSMSWQEGSQPPQTGNWTQQGTNPYLQHHYPPPPEPSQVPKEFSPHDVRAELPDVRSPASAELSDVRSPVNAEMPELRSPVPSRVDRG